MAKYKQVKVNLTPDQYQLLEDHSNHLDITKAEWLQINKLIWKHLLLSMVLKKC